MHKLKSWLVVIGVLSALLPYSRAAEPRATQDSVMITDVSPDFLISGEETEIIVKVTYSLQSSEAGAIRLTANLLAPNGDARVASIGVKKGLGDLTLRAKIIPRYWSDVVSFGVNAALVVAVGDDLQTKALSVDRANFHIKPATKDKPASFWPTVPNTYVDGISIISVSPDTFVEGVRQEIVVKFKYELFSREEGEVTLSVSEVNSAARKRIGSKRLQIGKGETEVRASFIPKQTEGLPVAKLLISLGEFPRGKASTPLAWDEATISVK